MKTKNGMDHSKIDYNKITMKDFIPLSEAFKDYENDPEFQAAYRKEGERLAAKAARMARVAVLRKLARKRVAA